MGCEQQRVGWDGSHGSDGGGGGVSMKQRNSSTQAGAQRAVVAVA